MPRKRFDRLTLAALALVLALPVTYLACRKPAPPAPAPARVLTPDQQALRKIAEAAVRRYEALYGHLPLEEWPEQPRATYEHARRYLADLEGAGD